MPVYGERAELEKLVKRHRCSVCNERLDIYADISLDQPTKFYLACTDYKRTHHEGITRTPSAFELRGMEALNIVSRREKMVEQIGVEKTRALGKYAGSSTLTIVQAREIINTIWPDAEKASPVEVYKAIAICAQYKLNPLLRHIFLLPFWNKDKKRYDYSCVQGIGSNRLIASRTHHWTFLDDTPRTGTEAEQIKHYGDDVDPEKLRAVAKMRDVDTGAEVTAWGEWNKHKIDKEGKTVANEPKGTDKGNSMLNMACTRAERKGLGMLYPADMPDLPVVDERYEPIKVSIIEASKSHVDEETGEVTVVECEPPDKAPEQTKAEAPVEASQSTCKDPELLPQNAGQLFTWLMNHLAKGADPKKFTLACGVTEQQLKDDIPGVYKIVKQANPEWKTEYPN